MLLNASQRISSGLHARRHGSIPDDAYILIRVLCHKKDREASKFLKRQYQLPMSSGVILSFRFLVTFSPAVSHVSVSIFVRSADSMSCLKLNDAFHYKDHILIKTKNWYQIFNLMNTQNSRRK